MNTCEVRACRVAEIFDDPASVELFAEYARECANSMLGATAPERETYEALESSGCARCFAAYQDGAVCGFAFVLASLLPHYGRRSATVESLFVRHEARHSGLGWLLMSAVEDYARDRGCEAILYSAPVGSRLAKLLFLLPERYRKTNHVFAKRLA